MGHIQRHHLDQAQVFIPDDKTLQELDSQISPILEKIMLINQEIQSLARSRDTLLPKLMRGIVRVSDFNKN
jgi:type I restriction enzyme S subunit